MYPSSSSRRALRQFNLAVVRSISNTASEDMEQSHWFCRLQEPREWTPTNLGMRNRYILRDSRRAALCQLHHGARKRRTKPYVALV
jgi:hypothetical protein